MPMFTQFSGISKPRQINLSGRPFSSQPSNSETLLAKAREERRARERNRLEIISASCIQRVWRGRRAAQEVRDSLRIDVQHLLGQPELGSEEWTFLNRALMIVLWNDRALTSNDDDGEMLVRWCRAGTAALDRGSHHALLPLVSVPSHIATIRCLLDRSLSLFSRPTGSPNAEIVHYLYRVLREDNWKSLLAGSNDNETIGSTLRKRLIESLIEGKRGWVERLVAGMQHITPAQKSHPALPPLVYLLVMPSKSYPDSTAVRAKIYPAFLNDLLSRPNLMSSLPLSSLGVLMGGLQLWDKLIPLTTGAVGQSILDSGRLKTEMGKTDLLANLATIVVRTGMIDKKPVQDVAGWMNFLTSVLEGVEDGWGLWIERQGIWAVPVARVGSDSIMAGPGEVIDTVMDSDGEEDEELAGGRRRLREGQLVAENRSRARGRVETATTTKLLHLFSPQHLNLLAAKSINDRTATEALTGLVTTMLRAFRGSPRWEGILEGILQSEHGIQLQRQLWLVVRTHWNNITKATWEGLFTPSSSKTSHLPALQLFSTLYLQNLLTLPDDEFFEPVRKAGGRSALSLDEVGDLASIWKDLAFYGYVVGVGAGPETPVTKRKEELRSLMTQGVLAVSARNARRKFLAEGFWIMIDDSEMGSFIDTVCQEEQQLEGTAEEEDDMNENIPDDQLALVPPPWLRARRLLSKRQMAKISPRLGLLNNLPMTLPFESRVEIMGQFVNNDYNKLAKYMRRRKLRHYATIRRTHLSEDSFREFNKLGAALKGSIQITFLDEFGEEEMGIDGGGLFKEWLISLSKEVFDTDRGLWLATSQNELYPNPHRYAKEPHQLEWYTFIGRMLGKALYEGLLMNASFAGFFLSKWLGRQSYLDDLASLDYDLYKGLIALKNYPGDPEDMSLTFTLDQEEFGQTVSIDLKKNGSNIPVTRANRMEYIQLVCDFKLNKQIAPQCEAFFSGLSDIIDPKWLRMFDQQELQTLIGGAETPIDVDDLQQHSVMHEKDDPLYDVFWKVVRGMTQTELRSLLKFVTSTPNPPLLGFKQLNPQFGIRLNPHGHDINRLPTAAACMNLLKLSVYRIQTEFPNPDQNFSQFVLNRPRYKDEHTLKAKLLQAINSNAGFYLS